MTEPEDVARHVPRLLFLVTNSMTAKYLLDGQLAFLARNGFEVSLICSPGRHLNEVRDREGIRCYELAMEREIRPVRDLRSLVGLVGLLREARPDIICASTPKAGLLGMVAAALVRVRRRVYTVRGLRLETTRGGLGLLLATAERVASLLAHQVVCVSPSLRNEYLSRKLGARKKKPTVLAFGTSNGVDASRFHPISSGKQTLGISTENPVVGFVGRLVRDKGIDDLVLAFDRVVLPKFPDARLLVVGSAEPCDPISEATRAFLNDRPEVIQSGFAEDTAPLYRAMDVLAFPSYREGFPNAPLEAAATEVPTVAYRVTGSLDAVEHGHTGMLVPRGDWQQLGQRVCDYLADRKLKESHGHAARLRVLEKYPRELVWRAWAEFFHGVATPAERRKV